MLKRSNFSKLSISRVTTPKRRTFSYIFAMTCITKDDHLTAGASGLPVDLATNIICNSVDFPLTISLARCS